MSIQQRLDTVKHRNDDANLANEAYEATKNELQSSYRISQSLSTNHANYIKRNIPNVQLILDNKKRSNTDHDIVNAERELVRQHIFSSYNPKNLPGPVLMVGAGQYEIDHFNYNNVWFNLSENEVKDSQRLFTTIIKLRMERVKKNARKNELKIIEDIDKGIIINEHTTRTKKYETLKSMYQGDFNETQLLEERIIFGNILKVKLPIKFSYLYFCDCAYSFSGHELAGIMSRTGAILAYGYGLYPLKLIFTGIKDDEALKTIIKGDKVIISFTDSSENAYIHDYKKYKTILNRTVIGEGCRLYVIDHNKRFDHMLAFTISKAAKEGEVTRILQLPDHRKVVKILDIIQFYESKYKELRYITINKLEYSKMLDYALSIADKSLTFNNLMTWIRRSSGGFVINEKEIEKAWDSENYEKVNLALVIYFQAWMYSETSTTLIANVMEYYRTHQTNFDAFKKALRTATLTIFTGGLNIIIEKVYAYLIKAKTIFNLVIEEPSTFKVTENVFSVRNNSYTLYDVPVINDEIKTCHFPIKLNLGKQIIYCVNDQDPVYEFKTTKNQAKELKTAILEKNEENEDHLKATLESAVTSIYEGDISYHCKVFNIWGGPGTGKSWIAKQIALNNLSDTAIIGPFKKLEEEYKNYQQDGKIYNFDYSTMHKALHKKPVKVLIFDEWTNIDYRLIVQLVYKLKPLMVFMVGDEKQTGIRPNEGLSAIPYLNKSTLNTHSLKMNFRNNNYIVRILNEINGYDMESINKEDLRPSIIPLSSIEDHGKQPMFFSKNTAALINITTDVPTVRRLQGRTFDNVILYVSRHDANLIQNRALLTVAISRHRQNLEIVMLDDQLTQIVNDLFYITRDPVQSNEYDKLFTTTTITSYDNVTTDDYILNFQNYNATTMLNFLDNYEDYKFGFCQDCSFKVLHQLLKKINLDVQYKAKIMQYYYSLFSEQLDFFGVNINEFKKFLKILDLNILFLKARISKTNSKNYYTYSDFIPGNKTTNLVIVETPGHVTTKTFLEVNKENNMNKMAYLSLNVKTLAGVSKEIIMTEKNYYKKISTLIPYKVNCDLYLCQLINEEIVITENMVGKLIVNQYIEDEKVRSLTEQFITRVTTNEYIDDDFQDLMPELIQPKLKSYDAYLLSDKFLPFIDEDYTNQNQSQVLNKPYINNVEISEDYKVPINARGNVKKLSFRGYKFSPGFGNSYFANNNIQILQCLFERYAKKQTNLPLSQEGRDLAKDIVNYSKDLVDQNTMKLTWEEINKIFNDFTKKSNEKHYVEKYYGEILNSKHTINFTLKDIFKPYKEFKVNKEKVGQGISAWQTELNLIFNVTMRVLAAIFKKTTKKNLLFNNGYDDKQIIKIFNEKLLSFPPNVNVAVIDATQFDSCQNTFTQEIEKQFLLLLGANEAFLELYYSFRNNYILKAMNIASTTVQSVKTSGEPATLLLNSILELMLLNYLVTGTGEKFLMVQGDDGLKFQVNLKLNQQRYERIKQFCNLNIKLEIDNVKEFCGYIVYEKGLYLSLYRIFQKITGKHFRDYEHFAEYQISLRDKLNFINFIGLKKTVEANVVMYKSNINTITTIYDIIRSWAHINKEQFFNIMKYQEIEFNTVPLYSKY